MSIDDYRRATRPEQRKTGTKFNIAKTYDYTDASGKLLYQVCRMDPKDFMQRKPDGKGGWTWKNIFKDTEKAKAAPRVLYRWHDLLKYPDATVFVTEGEKDADRLESLGLCATTTASHVWTEKLANDLKGRDVFILADNDDEGREFANVAAEALNGKAKSIRIVEFSDLPHRGDVSDWLDADRKRGAEALLAHCLQAPDWKTKPLVSSSVKPAVVVATDASNGILLEDFVAYLPKNSYYHVPTGMMWSVKSLNAKVAPIKEVSASDWLVENRCVVQMVWAPGEPQFIPDKVMNDSGWVSKPGVSVLNQYRPPIVSGGDARQAGRWTEHVEKVYGKEASERLLDWFAHRVQRPGEKINHAICLGGSTGIGKDSMLAPVLNAVGPWNAQDIVPKKLFGTFNGFVRSVILRISEAHDLGDINRYAFHDGTKIYCAAPPDFIQVNEKFLKECYAVNVCGVIFTTNHRDGLFLPSNDRRHYVLWSELTEEDFPDTYWPELWKWYRNGGFEHVAAFLAARDISKFNPKEPPPKTAAFWAMVQASAAPEDSEFADLIDRLPETERDAITLSQLRVRAEDSLKAWIDDRRNSRSIPHRMASCGYVPVRNEARKEGNWVVLGKRQVIYGKETLPYSYRYEAALKLAKDHGPPGQ